MTPLSTLIFDVDGTLAETEDCHRKAFNLAFEKTGMDWAWDHALYLDLLSVTGGKERMRHYAERHDPGFLEADDVDDRILSLHRLKTDFYVEIMQSGDIALRPGIARLLNEARQQGLRLAIATTTTRANVTNLLTATLGADGPGMFAAISAADSAERKKPAPDVYFDVLEKLGSAPGECLTFEDSQPGLIAARAAGIDTVVTRSAFTACDDYMDALAVLSDLGEPGQPCEALRGHMRGHEFVDLELLQNWRGKS